MQKDCKRELNPSRLNGVHKVAGCPRVPVCSVSVRPKNSRSEERLWVCPAFVIFCQTLQMCNNQTCGFQRKMRYQHTAATKKMDSSANVGAGTEDMEKCAVVPCLPVRLCAAFL